ncbi:MAG TPA: (5-formylfuran-3-yl)methyl phosphate synthase [Gemmatimonadales bacterium]|nr:(5-formylfuran-3-yl)methyl phosphate synthase [Gemmatimonadales bacterium]
MRLLVSVSDAAEARAALAGGAQIVDAKDPARGTLAPLTPALLRAVREAVPAEVPLSAALGDAGTVAELAARVEGITVTLSFVKLGFRGFPSPRAAAAVLAGLAELARSLPGSPGVIAVAYADWERVGSLPVEVFPALVGECGGAGLLVDTALKDGTTLFDWMSVSDLGRVGAEVLKVAPEFALAGSLGVEHLALARSAGATVVGVRGAACDGGRRGRVSEARVAQLARSFSARPSTSSSPTTDQGIAAAAREK